MRPIDKNLILPLVIAVIFVAGGCGATMDNREAKKGVAVTDAPGVGPCRILKDVLDGRRDGVIIALTAPSSESLKALSELALRLSGIGIQADDPVFKGAVNSAVMSVADLQRAIEIGASPSSLASASKALRNNLNRLTALCVDVSVIPF